MEINKLWNNIIKYGADTSMTLDEFLSKEWNAFMLSDKRRDMLDGIRYYEGKHDILRKKRMVIGAGGNMEEVKYLPNHKIVYNRFTKLVDQKVNYLFARPYELRVDDEKHSEVLDIIFDEGFVNTLRNVATDSYMCGVAYLHPYIDNNGAIKFKRFSPIEVLPFYKDDDESEVDSFLRVYEVEVYEGTQKNLERYAEYYTIEGVTHYKINKAGAFIKIEESIPYMNVGGSNYNWEKVPIVTFKRNFKSMPLITSIKALQDALNTLASNFADNMAEDVRNTIFVIKNYDGQNLGEFRHNLSAYGAVKVRTVDGVGGDVDTLQVSVNADNYERIIKLLKRAIVECGNGFDADDERMGNNPNQMNIQSVYSAIDLDANATEAEFKIALKRLLWFVSAYLGVKGITFDEAEATFVFNRDTPINEGEVIKSACNSVGILSMETIIKNHPWTVDTTEELKALQKERESIVEDYVLKE